MRFFVYIMSNRFRTVLYIGMTNHLERRIGEHENRGSGFTNRYLAHDLLYYEEFPTALEAISREKQLKAWRREKKIELIRSVNPRLETIHFS